MILVIRNALICAAALFFTLCSQAQTNGIFREIFSDIPGTSIASLTNAPSFPKNPTAEFLDSSFEAPQNFNDNYGQRMRAFVLPPITGNYIFWISSDDNSALFLSPDENPANRIQIASVQSSTGWRVWDAEPNQKSVPITLTNGFRYYIEALHKEGLGSDNLSVRWMLPDGTTEEPIPELRMTPFGLTPPKIVTQPKSALIVEAQTASFNIEFTRYIGLSMQWQSAVTNGASWVDLLNETNASLVLPSVAPASNGVSFRCVGINSYGAITSAIAVLTVTTDVTPPVLQAVGNIGNPQLLTVVFSEPLELESAISPTHYRIDHGISVLAAELGADNRTVILSTSPMSPGALYTLTVNDLFDRATKANPIAVNSQQTFTIDPHPLPASFLRASREPAGPSSRHDPIAITEIMYHPAPRADARNIEFIEIYNSQPYFADISSYQITGAIQFTFPTNTTLAGLGYLVIAASPSDIGAVYGITNVMGGFTNKLDNAGGTLRLLNRQHAILLEVNYAPTAPWPAAADGAGHSLVLSRPSLGERNPAAWDASDLIGGSPGKEDLAASNAYAALVINEFLAHPVPPQSDFVELYNYSDQALDISGCILTDNSDVNKFSVPANTVLAPFGFLSFDQTQLGFALSALGETLYLKNPDGTRILDSIRFEAQGIAVSMGRSPDGGSRFQRLVSPTPGTKNSAVLINEIVINEIMYAPLSGDSNDEYIELYNRGTNQVNLTGWKFTAGIDFAIPNGTLLAPDGYLVIAKNVVQLLSHYPNLNSGNTVGDFHGTVSNSGERLALSAPESIMTTNSKGQVSIDSIDVVVDEVTYGVGGRWGQWSHGGGSSLELIDPAADKNLAPNWADSDESEKSDWVTIEATGILDNGRDPANSLQIITLGAGEYLVDEVQVIPAGGLNVVTNSSFENGIGGWVPQGNHIRSTLEVGRGYNSSQSLHVRASSHGDTGANRIRTKLSSTLATGKSATIRAHVKWLHGYPEILFRLHGNWLEATGNVLSARNFGTPGMRNSSFVADAGPAITEVKHSPLVPAANQAVTVTARINDPHGLASVVLKFRIDPSTDLSIVPMENNGAGLFSAKISGRAAGTLAAFHIEARDNAMTPASATFPKEAPARECLVRWGDPATPGSLGVYRFWMTKAVFDQWSKREHLSNEPLDITFVYGNRVIYNAGGEYSGSPYHAPGFNTPTGNVCDYLLTFPEDDALLGETEVTLQWPGNGGGDSSYQREQTAYWIGEQIGLPYCYRRSVKLFVNGVRRAQLFEDVQQPNGDLVDEYYPEGQGGDLHKIQLWFEFDDAASTFSTGGADLGKYTTTGGVKKLARYRWNWPKRAVNDSANDYTNLFALVDAASTRSTGDAYTKVITHSIDVDNWMRTYAVEHMVGNNDSYGYGNGQNMYAYQPLNETWKLLIWDIDFAFSAEPSTSDLFEGGSASSGPNLAHPPFRRMYWQALQDAADGPLSAGRVNPLLDAKYAAFKANGATVDSPTSIKTYISQRRASIVKQLTTVNSTFVITSNAGNDYTTDQNHVTLSGKAPIDVRGFLINGEQYPIVWTAITSWTATIALQPGVNNLTIQGLDRQGIALTNRIATIHINYTGPAFSLGVFVNEWMADNGAGEDWFELYNASASVVDLSNYYLTDNLTNRTQFTIPAGYKIPPSGYLLVWADNKPSLNNPADPDLHAAFQLNKGGEQIGLFSPQGIAIDGVTFGPQTANVSQGRWPDGTENFYFMTQPTPRLPNQIETNNPSMLSVQIVGNSIIFHFSTYPGKHYRVEFSDDLSNPQWIGMSLDITAVETSTTTSDTVATQGARFYRIVQID